MNTTMKMPLIITCISLALVTPGAYAVVVNDVIGDFSFTDDSGNFTFLAPNGGVADGANDVNWLWDGDAFTSSTDFIGPGSSANITLSSASTVSTLPWAAHDVQMFVPGSYSFDVTLGGGSLETGSLAATVGAGQLGMHVLWDWNGMTNIDMFIVFNLSTFFGTDAYSANSACDEGYSLGPIQMNCLYDGAVLGPAGTPLITTVWGLASTDGNGDGIAGIPMASNGPFQNYNPNFNFIPTAITDSSDRSLAQVPLPAAAWLFASGLLGMGGIALSKRRTERPQD